MEIVFETPRLILRKFTEEDFPLIKNLNSDPEVVKYLHEPTIKTDEDAKNILINVMLPQYKNNFGRWAIHTKINNEFIGWCGLKHLTELDEIDLGYRIIKSAWHNGYATEAAQHTLNYGFSKLHLLLIVGKVHKENIASIKVLEKIGMQFLKEEFEDNCPIKIYTSSRPYTS